MRARLVLSLLLAASSAHGAGHEFDQVVKAVESHFGVTRTHIPLMGLANLVLAVAHPAGATAVHIALFPDLHSDLDEDSQLELDRFMSTLSSDSLHPVIRTRSAYNEEATYVFCGDTGKTTQVLIATFHRNEATVVEAKIQFETLMHWIQSPQDAGK